MFLQPDFGHRVHWHFESSPDAGRFTCSAFVRHDNFQVPPGVDMEFDSIRSHQFVANSLAVSKAGEFKEINRPIASHLMVIKIPID